MNPQLAAAIFGEVVLLMGLSAVLEVLLFVLRRFRKKPAFDYSNVELETVGSNNNTWASLEESWRSGYKAGYDAVYDTTNKH